MKSVLPCRVIHGYFLPPWSLLAMQAAHWVRELPSKVSVLSEVSFIHFYIPPFQSRYFLKADQESGCLHLVVLSLGGRKDLSWLSYPHRRDSAQIGNRQGHL